MNPLLQRLFSEGKIPYLSLLTGLMAMILFSFPNVATSLQYQRTAIADGEIWRMLTAHWLHWSFDHFLWCAISFVALGAICEQFNRKRFILSIALSAMIIPAVSWFVAPAMDQYRGLSGLCSTLFAFVCLQMIRSAGTQQQRVGLVLPALALFLFFAKILFEFITGQTFFVDSSNSFTPVPLAHLIGGFVGVFVGGYPGGKKVQSDVDFKYHSCERQVNSVFQIR